MNICIVVPVYNLEDAIPRVIMRTAVEYLTQYKDKSRLNLIQVTETTAATSILLSDKIENEELVIIAADSAPIGHSQRVAKVDFLGDQALLPQGPFILTSLLKYSVYTIFCLMQQGKQFIYFDYFSPVLKFPKKNREQAMQQTIQNHADHLRYYCLKEPLQWFNFFISGPL